MTIIHNAQVTLFCFAVSGVFVVIGCIVVELVVGAKVVVVIGVGVVGAGIVVVGAIVVVVGNIVVVSAFSGSSRIPPPRRKIIIIGFSVLFLLTKQTS